MNIKRNCYLMYAIVFLQGFVFYGPIATLYRSSKGLSIYDIFLIESIFMILMICFEIPWGWFADKFGYKLTLVISNLLYLVSKIIFYKATSFYLFLLERVFIALALSGLSGCDTALLYSSINKDDSEKVFGRYSAFSTLGFFIASLFSTILISKSMDYAAMFTIFPYAIAAILTLFIKDVNYIRKGKLHLLNTIKSVLKNTQLIIFIISVAFITEVSHSVTVFLNQLQYSKVGISSKYLGIILAGIQLLSILSAKTYKLTKKLGQKKTLKILFINISISCFLLSYTVNPIISVLLIAIIGSSFSMFQPISLDIQNKSIKIFNRATMLSIYAMAIDVISSVVNLSVGKSTDISLHAAFITCGIISAIGLILICYYEPIREKNI